MASHDGDQVPTVSLNQLDYLTDLQGHRSLYLVLPVVPRDAVERQGWLAAGTLRDPCDSGISSSMLAPAQALQHRPSYLNDQRSRCARTARGRSTWSPAPIRDPDQASDQSGRPDLNRRPLDPQSLSGCRWTSPSRAHWALEQPKQWPGVADCRLKPVHVGSRNGSPWSDAEPGERGVERAHLLPVGRLGHRPELEDAAGGPGSQSAAKEPRRQEHEPCTHGLRVGRGHG